MKQLTRKEFRSQFPNEQACAKYILDKQLAKGFSCKCGSTTFKWRDGIEKFYCGSCNSTASIFKDTIFYNTHLKLMDWFEVIYNFSISKNGISAKEVERQLGCSYRIAWRMLHKIRTMLNEEVMFDTDSEIEIDETYVGGLPKNWSKSKRKKHKELVDAGIVKSLQGRSTQNKNVIVGFYERKNQRIMLKHIEKGNKVSKVEIFDFISTKFAETNIFYTDDATIYDNLYKTHEHYSVDHSSNEYVFYKKKKDTTLKVSTNSIESFWAIVKRAIKGSYIHISTKHFNTYLNEFAFKFNNRNVNIFNSMFDLLV